MSPASPSSGKSDDASVMPRQLALGLIFGIAFGFLLQKGGVAKYDVLVGSLLLKDFTVFRVMLTAILVGMIGVFALKRLGLATLHPKPTRYGGNIIGGLIFGAGFALCGYCPGTGAAALGQASYDAVPVVIGMLVGSYAYAAASGWSSRTIERWGDRGKLLVPDLLHVRPLPVLIGMSVLLVAVLALLHDR